MPIGAPTLSRRAKARYLDAGEAVVSGLAHHITTLRRGEVEDKLEVVRFLQSVAAKLEKVYVEDVFAKRVRTAKRRALEIKGVKTRSTKVDCRRQGRHRRQGGDLYSNQSRNGENRERKRCENREIRESRPASSTSPTKEEAKSTTKPPKDKAKKAILVTSGELDDDDPRGHRLWGLSPTIWRRLTKAERTIWDALNIAARSSGRPARERTPAFLRSRKASPTATTPSGKRLTPLGGLGGPREPTRASFCGALTSASRGVTET